MLFPFRGSPGALLYSAIGPTRGCDTPLMSSLSQTEQKCLFCLSRVPRESTPRRRRLNPGWVLEIWYGVDALAWECVRYADVCAREPSWWFVGLVAKGG